jgi:hypothetical protein
MPFSRLEHRLVVSGRREQGSDLFIGVVREVDTVIFGPEGLARGSDHVKRILVYTVVVNNAKDTISLRTQTTDSRGGILLCSQHLGH